MTQSLAPENNRLAVVIEDDADVAGLLSAVLAQAGFESFVAEVLSTRD